MDQTIFAYYDLSSGVAAVMRRPAQRIFPFHGRCRSTPCSLEWEVRLGSQHPFRRAEELFSFFTRGAATVEDTTMARHLLLLSVMVAPTWLYKTPEKIREILETRATRDKVTNRPLLYVSSDASALRRYVDATWTAQWKMTNGIRLWCEDAATGAVIHLGGEFTWGDCQAVAARFKELAAAGILPNGDPPWKEVNPQVVFISDPDAGARRTVGGVLESGQHRPADRRWACERRQTLPGGQGGESVMTTRGPRLCQPAGPGTGQDPRR